MAKKKTKKKTKVTKKKKVVKKKTTKKTTKKKVAKKKTTKKSKKKSKRKASRTKKKTAGSAIATRKKKKKKAKKKPIKISLIAIEDVYRLLNRVQLNKKEVHFSVHVHDTFMIENIILDLELKHKIKKLQQRTDFFIYPSFEEPEELYLEIDLLDDETLERGQLF